MSQNKKSVGATLATAAALLFVTAPTTAAFAEDAPQVPMHCYGINECKGQSTCHTAKNGCAGENNCKGQGVLIMGEKDCKDKGGRTEE